MKLTMTLSIVCEDLEAFDRTHARSTNARNRIGERVIAAMRPDRVSLEEINSDLEQYGIRVSAIETRPSQPAEKKDCDHEWDYTNYGRSCKLCGIYQDV